MAGIFISYRRGQSAGYAGRLADDLADCFGKQHVFRDIEAISAGADFVEALDAAVGTCDALVVVITPGWTDAVDERGRRRLDNAEDFVRIEIETALRRKTWVIPVLVGGAVMPASDELPEPLRAFARRQAHEIRDASWDYNVDQLVLSMERRGLKPIHPAKEAAHGPQTAAQRPKSRKMSILAVGAVGIIAVAALVLIPKGWQPDGDVGGGLEAEESLAGTDTEPPIDVGTNDPSPPETSEPAVGRSSPPPTQEASLEVTTGKTSPAASPTTRADVVRSEIEDLIARAAQAEIAAFRDLDVEPLYSAYGGIALDELETSLAELASAGFHGLNTLHDRQIISIEVSPDGNGAQVEMIEAWSAELHNEAMGACLLIPMHDAHQMVHLVRWAEGWRIEAVEHYSVGPDPVPC